VDIELNEQPFPVGRNLWHFLEQMRFSEQYATYWIDAIAIDQSNVQERNHQVQMMKRIYSNAESVSVWLGEEDESADSDVAMEFLSTRELIPPGVSKTKSFWTPQQRDAVLALCQRPYWTRIWIVQEILLAAEVTIPCGKKALPWHQMQSFFDDIDIMFLEWGHYNRGSLLLKSRAAKIVETSSTWDGCSPPTLTSLMQLCRNQQSTDVRDMIYALHGLASDTHDIVVDYSITARQLLEVVLKHSCQSYLRKSREQILRTARLLIDVLQVHYDEKELSLIIDTEGQ
jgi:hypothetical protein